ncbi:MAG: hypothetical protein J6328_03650 [Bacilli bacterium]|nr:hypothetical protein [Bacilli bacterium]
MKFKSLILLGLSALTLASCTNEPELSSSLPVMESSIVPPASSSSDKYDAETALLYFLRFCLKPSNATVSIKDPTNKTTVKYFMGKDAVVFDENGSQSGVLVNGNQGLFEFKVNADNSITLGQSYGRSLDVDDVIWNPSFLASEREQNIWTIGEEGYMYSCTNPAQTSFGAYATMLIVGRSAVIEYLSSMTLKIADDLNSASLKLRYNLSGSIYTYNATFSRFGSTSVKAVADYVANPTSVPNATEFSSSAKQIAEVLFEDANVAPFPTGLVDYAFRDDYIADQEGNIIGFEWTYYGNNIGTAYSKILADKGYVVAQPAEANSDGDMVYTYKYVMAEPTESSVEVATVAQYHYDSANEEFVCQFSLYKGILENELASVDELNEKVSAINGSEEVTFALPSFDESSAITGIHFIDASEKFSASYSFYYFVTLDIADKATALSYLKAIEAKLLAAGYGDATSQYSLDTTGVDLYLRQNEMQDKASIVELDLGTSGEDYDGKIGIVFYGK